MKNLLKVFLGIFVFLNLAGAVYAGNYTANNDYNNSVHSTSYQYRIKEKQKSQSKYPEGLGTIILFIVVNIFMQSIAFIFRNQETAIFCFN